MQARQTSGEDAAPDVLASGSEREPRFTPAARRRLRLVIVVIIVSGAAVAGGVKVQERRVAAAEVRRVAGVFQLSADGPYGFGLEADPLPSLTAALDMTISVRNDSPGEVTMTRASAGGFVLLAPVPIPARTSRALVLHQELDCTADTLLPPPPPLSRATPDSLRWPGELQVTATTPQDTHTMTFARPPYDNEREAVTCDRLRSGQLNRLGGPTTPDPLRPGS